MPRMTSVVTSGAADAFAQTAMQTLLAAGSGQGYKILGVGFEIVVPVSGIFPAGIVALQDIQICLSRRTQSVMPRMTDESIIKKWWYAANNFTLAGATPIWQNCQYWTPETEIIIVEDNLYAQIDTNGTGNAYSSDIWIDYDIVKVTDAQRVNILLQYLN